MILLAHPFFAGKKSIDKGLFSALILVFRRIGSLLSNHDELLKVGKPRQKHYHFHTIACLTFIADALILPLFYIYGLLAHLQSALLLPHRVRVKVLLKEVVKKTQGLFILMSEKLLMLLLCP